MPNYTPAALIKRYNGKPDVHSRAIRMICDVAMGGVGPQIAVSSRRNRDILRVLMGITGWNMVLVGNVTIPSSPQEAESDAQTWASVIDIAAEVELEDDAPQVKYVIACSEGILVRFKPAQKWGGVVTSKKTYTRLQKAVHKTAQKFSEYESWGRTPLRPVVAEE